MNAAKRMPIPPLDTQDRNKTSNNQKILTRRTMLAASITCLLTGAHIRSQEPNEADLGTGSLVIAGGGSVPEEIWKRFIELAGGKEGNIIVIPTGDDELKTAQGVPVNKYWKHENDVRHARILHTRIRREADDPEFIRPLKDATGVWYTGGDQEVIMDAYRNTAFEYAVRQVYARGGVVGGVSAGAAIMSKKAILNQKKVHGEWQNPVVGQGIGLLHPDIIIDQHSIVRNRIGRLLYAVKSHTENGIGIGIDEHAAIAVQGGKITVLGNGQVVVCIPSRNPQEKDRKIFYNRGDNIDLPNDLKAWTGSITPHEFPASVTP